jgi:hypothetical protein
MRCSILIIKKKKNKMDNFLNNLTLNKEKLNSRIFNLVIGRVLKKAYIGFDEEIKKDMDEVFHSGSDEQKAKFMEKNIPDFQVIFEAEAIKIGEELKLEIEKEI